MARLAVFLRRVVALFAVERARVVAFFALFRAFPTAVLARVLTDRNVVALLVSMLIVVVLHVFAVLLSVESTYAVQMGAWSEAHYGTAGYFFWMYAEIFYRLVGMFGVVFVCWWLTINRK